MNPTKEVNGLTYERKAVKTRLLNFNDDLFKAIQEYVSVNEWQIAEIKKGLAEADAGDFATDEEMQQTIRRLTRRAR